MVPVDDAAPVVNRLTDQRHRVADKCRYVEREPGQARWFALRRRGAQCRGGGRRQCGGWWT